MRALLFLLISIFPLAAFAAPLKSGFSERDISPDIGMERPGGYAKGYHQKFHDACKARISVFDDGENAVALVGLDALFIMEDDVAEVRRRVAEATGIRRAAF